MSVFVRMLPYFEQGPLFNAYNSSTDATHPSNITIAGVGLSTLWCPSDPAIATRLNLSGQTLTVTLATLGQDLAMSCLPDPGSQTQTSYSGVQGPVCLSAPGAMGIIFKNGITRIASVTDGTSNTTLFNEQAVGWIPPSLLSVE